MRTQNYIFKFCILNNYNLYYESYEIVEILHDYDFNNNNLQYIYIFFFTKKKDLKVYLFLSIFPFF